MKKNDTPNSADDLGINRSIIINMPSKDYGIKNKKRNYYYTSYCSWFMNRFCKLCYDNKEARQKRTMLVDTLGLNNYLLHLDYIDRQIILEQQTGEINNKIKELLARSSNNNYDDSKENMEMNLDSDKGRKMSETETNDNFDTKNKMKELVEEDDI